MKIKQSHNSGYQKTYRLIKNLPPPGSPKYDQKLEILVTHLSKNSGDNETRIGYQAAKALGASKNGNFNAAFNLYSTALKNFSRSKKMSGEKLSILLNNLACMHLYSAGKGKSPEENLHLILTDFQLAKAQAYLSEAIRIQPDNTVALNNLDYLNTFGDSLKAKINSVDMLAIKRYERILLEGKTEDSGQSTFSNTSLSAEQKLFEKFSNYDEIVLIVDRSESMDKKLPRVLNRMTRMEYAQQFLEYDDFESKINTYFK